MDKIDNEWHEIKRNARDVMPTDKKQMVLFVQFQTNRLKTDIFVVTSYFGTWDDVQTFRGHELMYNYTHWRYVSNPDKSLII